MKSLIQNLPSLAVVIAFAQPSLACTITMKGDSHLRVTALHEVLDDQEALISFEKLTHDTYRIESMDHATGGARTRVYKLENTSAMCPAYKTILVR